MRRSPLLLNLGVGTGHLSAAGPGLERRDDGRAAGTGDGTTRVKDTTAGSVKRRRNLALEADPFRALCCWLDARDGRQQRLGVRVRWPAVHRLCLADLNEAAEIHHGDAVTD